MNVFADEDFFSANSLLVQRRDDITDYTIPVFSFVITGAISVGTSLLLVFAAMMMYRVAKRRKRHNSWIQWPTSSTPMASLDNSNSEYSSPNQSVDYDTSSARIKL